MNYNSVLDTFFSSSWLSLGSLGVLLVLIFIFHKPLYTNRRRKFLLASVYGGVLLGGFLVIILFNAMYFGYGKAIGVKSSLLDQEKLYVLDYRLASGGEDADPTQYYRVHVLDASNGAKQFRFLAGDNLDLLMITNDAIVCKRFSNEVIFFSKRDGSEMVRWNEETLPKLFPEMASGVDRISVGTDDAAVEVTTRDGKPWTLSVLSRTISSAPPVQQTRMPSPWKAKDVFIEKNGSTFLSLENGKYTDKRKQIHLHNDSIPNPSLYFLEGEFIAVSEKENVAIILHYTTTTKERWILSGVTLDGKQELWQLKQSELRKEENDEFQTENCWTTDAENGILYFSPQDETYCIQMRDGKLRWRTKL